MSDDGDAVHPRWCRPGVGRPQRRRRRRGPSAPPDGGGEQGIQRRTGSDQEVGDLSRPGRDPCGCGTGAARRAHRGCGCRGWRVCGGARPADRRDRRGVAGSEEVRRRGREVGCPVEGSGPGAGGVRAVGGEAAARHSRGRGRFVDPEGRLQGLVQQFGWRHDGPVHEGSGDRRGAAAEAVPAGEGYVDRARPDDDDRRRRYGVARVRPAGRQVLRVRDGHAALGQRRCDQLPAEPGLGQGRRRPVGVHGVRGRTGRSSAVCCSTSARPW